MKQFSKKIVTQQQRRYELKCCKVGMVIISAIFVLEKIGKFLSCYFYPKQELGYMVVVTNIYHISLSILFLSVIIVLIYVSGYVLSRLSHKYKTLKIEK